MGKEIVRQESPKSPGERSRLWLLKDIVQVFEKVMGTDKIEMIHMDFPMFGKVIKWDGKAFKKMRKIRTLIIRQARFSQGPKQLPNSLRVLKWQDYPSRSLPLGFHPEELVIFQLSSSSLMSVEFLHKQKFKSLTVLKLDWSNIEEIPDVSGVPNLKELSLLGCGELSRVHESVGFLDKLQLLCAQECSKLRSFPPIKLTSLVDLNLQHCFNLENFPEILGEMESISKISLICTSIKELPSSITDLTKLTSLDVSFHEMVHFPSSIVMLPCLEDVQLFASEGFRFSKLDQVEAQGSSMISSNAKVVTLTHCNMSNECWHVVVTWFRNVVKLTLDGSNFTILPESIQEFCSLRFLSLTDCKKLREIRGIPPNIEELTAARCMSLTCSSKIMLLNKELHEGGNKIFILPGSTIPEWFEHSSKRNSISFWLRHKLPEILLCLVDNDTRNTSGKGTIGELIINGSKLQSYLPTACSFIRSTEDHIAVFGLNCMFHPYDVRKMLSPNQWNCVVYRFPSKHSIKHIGMHVVKHTSYMEDIRFSNLIFKEPNKGDDLPINLLQTHWGKRPLLRHCVAVNSWNHTLAMSSVKDVLSNFIAQIGTSISTTDVQGCGIVSRKRKRSNPISNTGCGIPLRKRKRSTLMLHLNNKPSNTESFHREPSSVALDSDSAMLSLARITASEGENTPAESSQSPPSGIASGELHLRTCCTVLPTSDDPFRIQIGSSRDDGAEMENFYASLDSESHVPSRSHDHSATTAPNEEAREALKIV